MKNAVIVRDLSVGTEEIGDRVIKTSRNDVYISVAPEVVESLRNVLAEDGIVCRNKDTTGKPLRDGMLRISTNSTAAFLSALGVEISDLPPVDIKNQDPKVKAAWESKTTIFIYMFMGAIVSDLGLSPIDTTKSRIEDGVFKIRIKFRSPKSETNKVLEKISEKLCQVLAECSFPGEIKHNITTSAGNADRENCLLGADVNIQYIRPYLLRNVVEAHSQMSAKSGPSPSTTGAAADPSIGGNTPHPPLQN